LYYSYFFNHPDDAVIESGADVKAAISAEVQTRAPTLGRTNVAIAQRGTAWQSPPHRTLPIEGAGVDTRGA
jgi:hypothetical protein